MSNITDCKEYDIPKTVIFNNDNLHIADKIVYAPIYMVMFLEKSNVAPLYIKRTFPDYKQKLIIRTAKNHTMKIRNPFKKKKKIELLLTDWEGADGCLATDRIAVDGMPVGYMYREEPADNYQGYDSGWRFFAGDEDDSYDMVKNSSVYKLNTICNFSPDIIPLLHAPYGTAYLRTKDGELKLYEEALPTEEDE